MANKGGGKHKPQAPANLKNREVATGQNFSRRNSAPVVLLKINDKSADDLLRLMTSFSHKDAVDKATEVKMTFRNDDRRLLDDPRFFPNERWFIRFGYFADMSPIIPVLIRHVEPDYDMKRTVVVTLYDASLVIATKSQGKNWGTVPASEIARKIGKAHNMGVVVTDSPDRPKKAYVQPKGINDLEYLRDLATDLDYEVYVDGSPPTLYFKPKKYDSAPHRVLTYYDDQSEFGFVKKFKPKIKTLGPIASGVATPAAQKNDTDGKSPALGGKNLRVRADRLNPGQQRLIELPQAVAKPAPTGANPGPLAAVARQQMLDKCIEATSDHPMTPSFKKSGVYEWAGLEKQLNGKWYCTETHSTITGTDSHTSCEWKRNALGQGSTTAANQNTKKSEGEYNKVPMVVADRLGGSRLYPVGTLPVKK